MTKNYLPDDDVIEELLNITLSDEKKQELKEMRDQNVIATGKISDEDLKKVENALKKQNDLQS